MCDMLARKQKKSLNEFKLIRDICIINTNKRTPLFFVRALTGRQLT